LYHTPATETRVNTYTTGAQSDQRIAALDNGGWVVTWTSDGQDGESYGVYQQAYNADGTVLGNETRVNAYTTDSQHDPFVTTLDDGGWVVAWMSYNQDGYKDGIYQQAYNADGTALGSETQVNTSTRFIQHAPHLVALANGGWVTMWTSSTQSTQGDLFQQIYDQDGSPLGGETRINVADLYVGWAEDADITALSDGGWVVTWHTLNVDDWIVIKQQAYNANGTVRGGEVLVAPAAESTREGEVTALSSGGWVVTWRLSVDGGNDYDIHQQAYDADGAALGDETVINTYTAGSIVTQHTAALSDGGWVVTWATDGLDGSSSTVVQQRYHADGSQQGGETQVNSFTTGSQSGQQVTALDSGGWLVTWTSNGQDGDGQGIYQQAYKQDGSKLGAETQVNTYATGDQWAPQIAALSDGGWMVTWTSDGADGDTYTVLQQRYNSDGEVYGINHAPSAADVIVSLREDHRYAFSNLALGFTDAKDGDALASVTITALPGNGTLKLDGVTVTTGQVISAADLTDLIWTPDKNAFGTSLATIRFTMSDDGGTLSHGADTSTEQTITFDVSDVIDTFSGRKGADRLSGTAGGDILIGGRGNDRLTGSAGADFFVFHTGDGRDTITDFDASESDKISLSGVDGITSYRDLIRHHVKLTHDDIRIEDDAGARIILKHTDLSDLHRTDFVL
jgi:hypothetical protein